MGGPGPCKHRTPRGSFHEVSTLFPSHRIITGSTGRSRPESRGAVSRVRQGQSETGEKGSGCRWTPEYVSILRSRAGATESICGLIHVVQSS